MAWLHSTANARAWAPFAVNMRPCAKQSRSESRARLYVPHDLINYVSDEKGWGQVRCDFQVSCLPAPQPHTKRHERTPTVEMPVSFNIFASRGGRHISYFMLSKRVVEVLLMHHLCGNLMQPLEAPFFRVGMRQVDAFCSPRRRCTNNGTGTLS